MDEAPKYRFVVESDPAGDALARLLDAFVRQAAAVEQVEHAAGAEAARTVIRASGLAAETAEALTHKLRGLPFVRSVGFGW